MIAEQINPELGHDITPPVSFPEAVPRVIFDTGIGQKAEDIDFNYQAFYDLAHESGFSNKAIENYTIHFIDTSKRAVDRSWSGKYSLKERKAEIYVGNILEADGVMSELIEPEEAYLSEDQIHSKILSRVVAHETGHHSKEGRRAARLATSKGFGIILSPLVTAVYGGITKDFIPLAATGSLETLAFFGLMAKYDDIYTSRIEQHKRRKSEKPAYALQEKGKDAAIVNIRLL